MCQAYYGIMGLMILLILLGIAGVVDLFVLVKLIHAFKLLYAPSDLKIDENDLPSISICIPARNETHAMTQSLERAIASDYPKLEIIVLDDGSRDDTSVLIKSFAHEGVRFVEGKPLPEDWLGKNYAQYVLAKEASGKYIFFMDVDTLIDRFTVSRAVSYMLSKKAKMASFVPIRNVSLSASTLMTPMRYFWVMMRFLPKQPRAVSNAWIIDRALILDEFEHDSSLPSSMLLETTIAKKLAPSGDYRLATSNAWLGIRYEKRWSSQIETSIRLLYPQCDAYMLQVIWFIVLIAITLLPYFAVWWQPWALGLIVFQYALAFYYLSKVWSRYRFVGALIMPFTLMQEVVLFALSMYHYKRGSVTWKGRPVGYSRRTKS